MLRLTACGLAVTGHGPRGTGHGGGEGETLLLVWDAERRPGQESGADAPVPVMGAWALAGLAGLACS